MSWLFTVPTAQPSIARGLCFGEVLVVAEHDGRSLPRWQLGERGHQTRIVTATASACPAPDVSGTRSAGRSPYQLFLRNQVIAVVVIALRV